MAEQTPQRCVCGPSGEDIDVHPDCPRHGEQTPQERLAQELRKLAWSDYFDPDTWAAQLLDSDVIREMRQQDRREAWFEGKGAGQKDWGLPVSCPYEEASDGR